jgi:hypothetical protein
MPLSQIIQLVKFQDKAVLDLEQMIGLDIDIEDTGWDMELGQEEWRFSVDRVCGRKAKGTWRELGAIRVTCSTLREQQPTVSASSSSCHIEKETTVLMWNHS